MTKQEALEALKRIEEDLEGDPERLHIQCDDVLLALVDEEVAKLFEKISEKFWYA